MREFKILLPVFLLFFSLTALGQDEPIFLENPSFEGQAMAGQLRGPMPEGWVDCGFAEESVPDVHPEEEGGAFKVFTQPHDGETYLGMVVRDNETWERVTQLLSRPLEAGKCYTFSISLARSLTYESTSRTSQDIANFSVPAKLRIWGGTYRCNQAEKLAESSIVTHEKWKIYNFRFEPEQDLSWLIIEAFYNTPTPFPYNGNILVDNASPIFQEPCEAVVENPPPPDGGEILLPSPPPKPDPKPGPEVVEVKKEPKILKNLDRNKLKVGETIRMDQLFFQSDSSRITTPSFPVLNEVYDFLSDNPDVVVEIGGHTNGIPPHDYCDRLSNARAKAVADYLSKKGIPRERLKYKGYGKRKPIETNKSAYGRKRNQRVEIKILSFNG